MYSIYSCKITNLSQVSEIFGGLEVCALELVVGKDGREHIIELNDSATTFMGDSQEEDRRHLAELVLQRMQVSSSLMSFQLLLTTELCHSPRNSR